MQNVEQVHPVSISTLPAPETFNFFFKNTIYCKQRKFACGLGFTGMEKVNFSTCINRDLRS